MGTDEADRELEAAKEASVVGMLHRGAEVLLYDGDPRVRDGFRKLLKSAGLVVTATDDAELAQSLASDKHFAVAIIDLDTPETDGGLALLSALHTHAPATSVVLLTARQIFSVAVEGFRLGARDVIAKSPENVRYLTDVVVRECHARDRAEARETLFAEVMEVHEDFLKRLMEASRAKAEAEERNSGSSMEVDLAECVVLVADVNPNTARGLEEALSADGGYKFISVLTGGEALDKVGQTPFQLALVSSDLPDLPSSMIAKSLRAESAEGIVLLFSHPDGDKPGRADIIEPSQSIELIPELRDGAQLVEQIHELRKAYVAKARERRYLRVFRRDHYEFLRRYVEVRQKLLAAKPEAKE
ncbi:MAG: response regulator [Deltaproteobacteria bacterium]|nr:response regulator [Deltaproteobacteria bacterium]